METYIKRAKKGDIEAFINLMDINKTYMYPDWTARLSCPPSVR